MRKKNTKAKINKRQCRSNVVAMLLPHSASVRWAVGRTICRLVMAEKDGKTHLKRILENCDCECNTKATDMCVCAYLLQGSQVVKC